MKTPDDDYFAQSEDNAIHIIVKVCTLSEINTKWDGFEYKIFKWNFIFIEA